MLYKFLPLFIIPFLLIEPNQPKNTNISTVANKVENSKLIADNNGVELESNCESFYNAIDTNLFSLPKFESFLLAYEGFERLKEQGKVTNEMLTIVDFSLSSKEERMWVINMKTKEIVLQTLVAHGRNSGMEYAENFSNQESSFKSSLGFYLTGEVYQGKHGTSLRLDGQETGINSNARNRAVVIHGADYVSKDFVKTHGRLGRSQGCPAVSYEVHQELIETIKDKSVLFIYHPSRNYLAKSKLVS